MCLFELELDGDIFIIIFPFWVRVIVGILG